MMKKLLIGAAILFFSLPLVGFSQIESGFGIGPRLGYYKAQDAEEGNMYFGVQARARLSPYFGIEGAVDYRTAQEYELGDFAADVRQVPVTATALVFLPVSDYLQPYGLVGLGAYYSIIDFNDNASNIPGVEDDHSVDFGYHLGFGLEIPINNSAAINADYRYIYLDPGSDTFGDVEDAEFSSNAFTVGIMFYL